MAVNDRQVGGEHYAAPFQHWDLIIKYGVSYLPAQVSKYITRCHRKNKREDLEKALHYAEKMVECMNEGIPLPASHASITTNDAYADVREFARCNGLDAKQELLVWMCVAGSYPTRLVNYIRAYMQDNYPQEGDPLHVAKWRDPVRYEPLSGPARLLDSGMSPAPLPPAAKLLDGEPDAGYVNQGGE